MPRRSRWGLACTIEQEQTSQGLRFRATNWPAGANRPRIRAKGSTIPKAVARLVLKLEGMGETEPAARLRASAEATLGGTFIEALALTGTGGHQGILPPLGEALRAHVQGRQAAGHLSAGTHTRYLGILANHFGPGTPIAAMPLDSITTADVEGFLDNLRAKTRPDGLPLLGPSPMSTVEGLLNQVFSKAVTEARLARSPMVSVDRTRKHRRAAGAEFAAHPGAGRFITLFMQEMPYQDFLLFFPLGFGLRTSERLALRHGAFATAIRTQRNRLPRTVMTVDRQLGEDLELVPLKKEARPRTLPLPLFSAPHVDALYLQRAIQLVTLAEERGEQDALGKRLMKHASTWQDPKFSPTGARTSPLFVDQTFLYSTAAGTPIRRQGANSRWRRLLETYGEGVHVREHDVRHVVSTELGKRNFPPALISDITGHAVDPRSTLQAVYTHPSEEQKQAAMGWLGALVARPAEPPTTPLPGLLAEYCEQAPLWSLWRADRETDEAVPPGGSQTAHMMHSALQWWMPEHLRTARFKTPLPALADLSILDSSTHEWFNLQGIDPEGQFSPRGKLEGSVGREQIQALIVKERPEGDSLKSALLTPPK